MSKENIEDAVYEEVNNSKEKVNYEIEVELTENFLEKNPTIKHIYNQGKINIGLLPNVDKEFVDKIVELVPELKSNELVLFNPLIEAINILASQDFITEEPMPKRMDYEEDKDFNKRKKTWLEAEYRKITDINKSIGNFNTTLKESKKVIKAPIIERGKKIDALYNALVNFSESRKEVAKSNFPKYLDAAEKIKQAKIAKANAEALAEKEALEAANAEATEKIEALSKKSSYADLMTEIASYFNGKSAEIETSNQKGLLLLKQEVTDKVFDFSDQGELEKANLMASEKMFKNSVLAEIEKNITDENVQTSEQPVDPSPAPSFNINIESVEDNMADILRRLNSITGDLNGMQKFPEPKFEKVNQKFFEQIEAMKKTAKACTKYITAIQEKYNSQTK